MTNEGARKNLLDNWKDNLISLVTSRLFVLMLVVIGIGGALIYRVFDLQIVHGQEYLDNFQLKIEKQRSIPSTRGNIYDCNGKLLAYNELAYSVTIEDVYESGKTKNTDLNATIAKTIGYIEKNGDHIISDFDISLDSYGNFQFNVEGKTLERFLADVYGHSEVSDLKYKEKNASADDVVEYLCSRSKFGVGTCSKPGDYSTFVPEQGFTHSEILKILTVRYAMSANSYQKYIATTVAENVGKKTVATIMENSDDLDGVAISEGTIRKYNDSTYFSQIIGYTGKISQDELDSLQKKYPDTGYAVNDTVGKSGIEATMESELQGKKGSETVYVNNVGKVIETCNRVEADAGNDVYLTIDSDLQIAAYNILEEKLASIVLSKLRNIKEYKAGENSSRSDIVIPIYDVYYACINNNILDIDHFSSGSASKTEKEVYGTFKSKTKNVISGINEELTSKKTPYNKLDSEYQVYESYVVQKLYSDNIIPEDSIDKNDSTYKAWSSEEKISLHDYLMYAISKNWVNVSKLNITDKYSDSDEIFSHMVSYIDSVLPNDDTFGRKLYKYMILNDEVTGRQVCQMLMDQKAVTISDDEKKKFENGSESAFVFMENRIEKLDLTPAQLALDPYSGSVVITDVRTGAVKALVSYPSYDNNKMANGVDADYYAKLREDKSSPLINYATMQKTAPGSTFKMVSSTAGLMEGAITTTSTITCTGTFDKLDKPAHCWIYPGSHGALNITGGITNSCNCFFYEVGYRLGLNGTVYNSDLGLKKLKKYADLYGLDEKSGVEIDEATPEVSDTDSVRSAIGQGTNNFTTIGLSRYVTTVANSGTCYDLTLLSKLTDHKGTLIKNYHATVRNQIRMDPSYWNAIHEGMRGVVESKSYYADLGIDVAGKTGTAQESKSRPNHALFLSYAPYENPEISMAVRVANGYTSDYAAQIAKEVYKYYYGLGNKEDIITGTATTLDGGTINGD
jgi:penicillin-binding protein 2